jgi:tetratricopeptide (TPR) repeat protein
MQVYYAASLYRNKAIPEALAVLEQAASHALWASIIHGEMLALQPGKKQSAREVYQQVIARISEFALQPNDFVGVPETIPLLLGDQTKASEECRRRLAIKSWYSWQKEVVDFVADPQMEAELLLAATADSRYNRVVAHKVIAFRYLSQGDVVKAEEHLDKCYQTCPLQPDAFWAKALLSRLRTDDAWRVSIERRRDK